jgi:predicted O-methyltransferase YrrM
MVKEYQEKLGSITELCLESAAILEALLNFQARTQVQGDILEIGVFRAGTASLLAKFLAKSERLFLIDPFQDIQKNAETIVSFSGIDQDRLLFVRADSQVVNKQREHKLAPLNPRFRMVHIDGEHSYDAVMSDLDLATRFLAPGGIVVLDDIFNINSACCTQALFDYLASSKRLQCIALGFNKAYLCESRYLGRYHRLFTELPEGLQSTHGAHIRLCFNSWSGERTYVSMSRCEPGDAKYQIIGQRFHTLQQAMAARRC